MHVTFFKSQKANVISSLDLTLEELKKLILETSAKTKSELPWLKLARFGDNKSKNNSFRYNGNVVSISGVELDYDGKKFPMAEAYKILDENKIKSLVYTSPTNSRDAFKWRVLSPTSRELPPDAREVLAARINGLFRGIFARESFVLSQAYYYGCVDNNPWHAARVIEGDFIDHRDDLDGWSISPSSRQERGQKRRPKENGDATKVDPHFIKMAMDVIPNEDLDWNEWNRLGMALWAALEGDHFEIFDEWSKKSSKYNATETQDRWNIYFSCPPKDLGAGTIIYEANGAKPWWRNAYDDEVEQAMAKANREAASL